MTRRTPRIAGALALVAMTFALAEAVWASTCRPDMDMAGPGSAMGEDAPMDAGAMAGMPQDQGDAEGGERDCPFDPIASVQGCVGLALIPARAVAAPALRLESRTATFHEEGRHDLLFETALFHPPRA